VAALSGRDALNVRAFRTLLNLYPGTFRDEYRRELTLVFVDRYRNATGPWDRTRLWIEALAGVLAEASKEHSRMMLYDLRYAWRTLRHQALVTLTIVITLALGIGANTAIFSLSNAVALKTLPVPDPDHLFTVNDRAHAGSGPEAARLSGPMFERLRQAAPKGVGVTAMGRGVARVYTRAANESGTLPASLQLVSSTFFSVLGVTPALGRTLTDDGEGSLARYPEAVVSYGYWQRRFGGAPDVIGRSFTINGIPFTIIGVGPKDFTGVWLEIPVEIWAPLTTQAALKYSQSFSADGAQLDRPWLPQGRVWWLYIIVRSPPPHVGSALGAFNTAMSDLVGGDVGIVLEPFARGLSRFRQQFSGPLFALTVMAALVLLIACANVANLLLARAAGRQREIAVRMALGAGRARVLQQLLTESLLMVLFAGVAAILVAGWAAELLVRTATAATNGPAPFATPVDLRVLGFTAMLAFASVLLFGLAPAWRASRLDLLTALRTGGRGTASGFFAKPARVLVILQVALSLVLVTATGLFVRTFQNLQDVDLGIERERQLSVSIDPRLSGTPSSELPGMYQRILDALVAVPGVRSASLAMCGLQSQCALEDGFKVEGYRPRGDEQVGFRVNVVTPDYFSTVGMPIIAGRGPNDRDLATTPKIAVVNRTLAATYFPDGQAIGRRFGLETPDIEIVGIVEDARALSNIKAAAVPTIFIPLSQRSVAPRSVDVRTSADPRQTIAAVRQAIARAAPALPIEGILTIDERIHASLSRERLAMFLTSGFGGLALGLAGFGLFGVLSHAVARRTPELGLRMALGASPIVVMRGVVGEAMTLVLCGVLLGLPFVFLGGNLVATLFFGVSPHDWVTLGTATILLAGMGSMCSVIPALRAARVDPIVALREE
jgi:predicted permease